MTAAPSGSPETFFCDTAVIVAAADLRHRHHAPSVAVVRNATRSRAYCSAHNIAEVYAVLTSAAYGDRMRPGDVVDVIRQVRALFTVVELTRDEYFGTVEDAALRDIRGGQIYDALHLAAAAKVAPHTIYTWNVRHFRAVAPPALSERVRSPGG